jgi:hypothetical protein
MGWIWLSTAASRPSETEPKSVGPSTLRLGLEILRQDKGVETVRIQGRDHSFACFGRGIISIVKEAERFR